MHSRIFVLRLVEDGKVLPSMNDRDCVTESDLSEAMVPHHADYVDLISKEHWKEDIDWLCGFAKYFSLNDMKPGDDYILTLDGFKLNESLRDRLDELKEKVDNLTLKQFASRYSLDMYNIQNLINDEYGFWIITMENGGNWYYETLDMFLLTYCNIDNPVNHKFRVEDIFDYHM